MGQAKVVSLHVRPKYASHLCFEVNGILDQLYTDLGKTAPSFDFGGFFQILSALPTVPAYGLLGHPVTPADPSRLLYDNQTIQSFVQNFTLASLRAEDMKAALNKAINNRQNTYFAKYANKDGPNGIIATMRQYYDPNVFASKPDYLSRLAQNSKDQWNQVLPFYQSDGRGTGPLKTGVSKLSSDTSSYGYSNASSVTDGVAASAQIPYGNEPIPQLPPGPLAAPPWKSLAPPQVPPTLAYQGWFQISANTIGEQAAHNASPGSNYLDVNIQQATNSQVGSSQDAAHQEQTITPSDYGYRIPMIEAAAQFHRAQISLIDQQFAQFMFGQNLPNLEKVFTNELNSIDLDVYRLQIAYLRTFLMLPASLLPPGATATVTGIYKRPGEAVRAGEPIIRVENTDTVLLEGTLVYPGRIGVGSTVKLTTNLFDSDAIPPITGATVAARGRRNDDQWEVIIECSNLDANKAPIFPLGYHFDYDDTTVLSIK